MEGVEEGSVLILFFFVFFCFLFFWCFGFLVFWFFGFLVFWFFGFLVLVWIVWFFGFVFCFVFFGFLVLYQVVFGEDTKFFVLTNKKSQIKQRKTRKKNIARKTNCIFFFVVQKNSHPPLSFFFPIRI